MRQDTVIGIVRQLGTVVSKRVGMAVGIWGDAGIGKTHAAQAVLECIPCRHLTLHATTRAAQIANALPRTRALPGWVEAQLDRLGRGESLEPRSLAQTFAAALGALAPFVLHLEDVHEAEAEQSEMIHWLALAVTRMRGVGLLTTSRAELPEPLRNHRLESLTAEEASGLIEQELKVSAPQEGLAWVFGRTRGNPLFTLEFVRYLTRQGFLWSDGQRWNWRTPPEDFVPLTVEALVLNLVSSAAHRPETRAVLEARAILPDGLDPERLSALWAQSAGVDITALGEARWRLEQAGLLRGEDFAHPLFAEVVAAALDARAKCVLARRIIDATKDTDPEQAARFIADARLEAAEALGLLKRAADRARLAGEDVRAAYLLGLAAGHASGEERVRLALEAENGLLSTGDYRRREELARLALEAQPENREVRHVLANVYALTGRDAEVRSLIAGLPEPERQESRWAEVLFRALFNAGRDRDALKLWETHELLRSLPQARNAQYAIGAFNNLGEFERAEELIHRVLERSDLTDRMRLSTLNALAVLRSDQGQLEQADALYTQCLALAYQGGNLNNIGTAYYNRALNQGRRGQFGAARSDVEEAIRLMDQAGNATGAAYARVLYGDLLLYRGEFERAERVLLEAHGVLSNLAAGPRRVVCESELALLYAEWRPMHGKALARKVAHEALEHARTSDDAGTSRVALIAASRVAVWTGEAPEALELARQAMGMLEPKAQKVNRYSCLAALARALEANEQHDEALEHWNEALNTVQTIDFQLESHEAELEIARLRRDWAHVGTLRAWFDEHGLALGVQRADAYLGATPSIATVAPSFARLEVLGPVRLFLNGQIVPTRARKRLEILTYLLETRMAGRAEASALEIVDDLYPDTSEPEARNTLKQQIYLLRSSLGPETLVSTPTGYSLGAVSSDAEELLRSNDSSLWRGAYLAQLGEGWRAGVRESLSLALRANIESLLETDPAEAARLGAILCEMEPYDADALRLAVRALESLGDTRGARHAFLEGRSRLEEIGVSLPTTIDGFMTRSSIASLLG